MIGDAGGKLKAGRYVDYPGYGMLGTRQPHTTPKIAGHPAERFGMADPNLNLDQTGPLTELLANLKTKSASPPAIRS